MPEGSLLIVETSRNTRMLASFSSSYSTRQLLVSAATVPNLSSSANKSRIRFRLFAALTFLQPSQL